MTIQQRMKKLVEFLSTDIWLKRYDDLGVWQRRGLSIVRTVTLSFRLFQRSRSDIQPWALTAITVLSLVPMLAFVFSIAKALGFYTRLREEVIEPGIDQWVNIQQAPELHSAVEQLLAFVEHTDFSSLGTFGFATIAYASIRLLGAVEAALNDLWEVKSGRSMARKISDYLFVAVIVPVLLLIAGTTSGALSHSGSLQEANVAVWGDWAPFILRFVTLLIIWFGFSILYRFMPHTKVAVGASLRGGIFGGSLWMVFHLLHIKLQIGVANYNAIYAGFSAFPIFMMWVYFSWWAVLLGGAYAASYQKEDDHRHNILRKHLNFRRREQISLQVAIVLARYYEGENTCCPIPSLLEELQIELPTLEVVLMDLKKSGVVVLSTEQEVVLAKDPRRITILDVLDTVKGEVQEEPALSLSSVINCAHQSMGHFQQMTRHHDSNKTLHELVRLLPRKSEEQVAT